MSQHNLWLVTFTLCLILCQISLPTVHCQVATTSSDDDGQIVQYKTIFNNFDKSIFVGNNQVAFTRDRLFLFMWKNMTLTQEDASVVDSISNSLGRNMSEVKESLDSLRNQLLPNTSSILDEDAIDNMRKLAVNLLFYTNKYTNLRIGLDSTFESTLFTFITSFYNITNNSNMKISSFRSYYEQCRPMNLFEEYDIIISTSYLFNYYIRFYRDASTSGGRKLSGQLINPNDFFFVPLFPSDVVLIDNTRINNSTSSYAKPCECYNTETEFKGYTSDMVTFNLFSNFGKISKIEQQFIEYVFDLYGVKATFNDSLRENLESIWKGYHNFTFDQARSYNDIFNLLLPSSCHKCITSTCSEMNFKDGDYWYIPNLLIVFFYFTCLFLSKSFMKPFIVRRLLMPYLPALIIWYEFFHLNVWKNICSSAFVWVEMFLICTCVCIYSFTIVRLYYLKNLYSLIRKFKNHFKIFKMLASVKFGFLFTGVFSIVLSSLLSFHGISMIVSYDGFFLHNESIAAYLLFGTLVGVLCIIIDYAKNFKNIQKNGIGKFMFFDDPFHIRIDLIQLVAILILVIINIIVVSTTPEYNSGKAAEPIPRFLINCLFVMICGGAAMLTELINYLRFGRKKESHTKQEDEDDIEITKYLNNADFVILFEEYSEKELSLENIYAYKLLMKMANQCGGSEGSLTREMLTELAEDFIKNGSIHELNIPSDVRRQFNTLFEKSEKSGAVTFRDLNDILLSPLLMNIMDTFSRLVLTNEYNMWEQTFNVQQKNAIEV